MGWNGSDLEKVKVEGRGMQRNGKCHSSTSPIKYTAFIAVLLLILGSGIGVWLIGKGSTDTESLAGKDEPQRSKTAKKPSAAKASPEDVEKRWAPNVELNRTKDVEPPKLSQREIKLIELSRQFFGDPVFTNNAENFIAGVLSSVPGDRFLTDHVGRSFDKEFAASLKTPIVISPDDSEDVAAQKQAVIAAKKTLAEGMDKGESPAETLSEMIKDLNEIADYRDKLQDNVRLILKEGTEEDVRLYVEESNRNLEQYNARKIVVSDFQYELLRRRIQREKEKKSE